MTQYISDKTAITGLSLCTKVAALLNFKSYQFIWNTLYISAHAKGNKNKWKTWFAFQETIKALPHTCKLEGWEIKSSYLNWWGRKNKGDKKGIQTLVCWFDFGKTNNKVEQDRSRQWSTRPVPQFTGSKA